MTEPVEMSRRIGKTIAPKDVIGYEVFKASRKPFKSGNKTNTVKGITRNPNSDRKAFTFHEDDSVVDCHQCGVRLKYL